MEKLVLGSRRSESATCHLLTAAGTRIPPAEHTNDCCYRFFTTTGEGKKKETAVVGREDDAQHETRRMRVTDPAAKDHTHSR
ncbi:hypothetical protein C0J52_14213 [Blattella germanica]|nr:hypothetical protein C0J52_14213 [Blattella germanica]